MAGESNEISNVNNSVVNTGNAGSIKNSVTTTTSSQLNESDLNSLLHSIELQSRQIPLNKENQNELYLEVKTIKTQLEKDRPSKITIGESLKGIKVLLESVAGSMIATELIRQIDYAVKALGS